MAGSFIFGKGQEYATPEELAKARAMAEALLGPQRAPQNVGEGLTAIGQAIRGRMDLNRVNRAEAAGKSSAAAAFNPILQALSGKSGEFPPAPGGGGSSAKASPDFKGDELAWTDAKPYQKALLNTIAGPESGGRYNVIYGGGKFDDFSKHPGQAVRIQTGPNAGRTSSAAGKYQFLGSTWQDQAGKLGLTDFSPANQDKAAWNLAAETYKAKTGQDLDAVLQSNDPAALANVGKVLNPIWTSLPGGIEQGTNTDRFVSTYQRALNAGASPAQAQQAAQQEQTKPVQVASLDPSAGVAQATQVPPMPEEYAKTGLSPEAWAKMNAPTGGQGVAKALAGPPQQPQPAAPQGQQVAQALSPDRLPVTAGGNADAIQPGQGGGLGMQQLLQAAQNPWLDQQQRGLINMLIEKETQKNDPARMLEMEKNRLDQEKTRIEIEQMRNPQMSPAEKARLDLDKQKFEADQNKLLELSSGTTVYDPKERKPIYTAPKEAKAPTVQTLKLGDGSEIAVQWDDQGQKWVPIDAPSGGGDITPKTKLTEAQSKLTLFQSLQTETQPVLLDLEKQFNPANFTDSVARSSPIAGNFFQSEQGQIYQAAATAWAEGALRIATGAAATPEEMERTKKAYFAQPGDTPVAIAFKAQMREMYNRAINKGLGSQENQGSLPLPSEFIKQITKDAQKPSEAPKKQPQVIDGYTIEEVE